MATGTNGIATEGEAKIKLGYNGSVDTNKCCTKARAIAMGADSAKLSGYKDSKLIKYTDLVAAVKDFKIDFHFNKKNGTFYLSKQSNIPTPVTVNLKIEYNSGNDTTHTVSINQGSMNSSTYSYASYSYPLAWTVLSFNPTEFTYSGTKFRFVKGFFYQD